MTKPSSANPLPSPYRVGLRSRCPICGVGPVFAGFLTVRSRCDHCDADLSVADPADGPAVFIMMILGFIVAFSALIVEVKYEPPYWVHAAIWLPLTLLGGLAMLRPFKATLIALQFHHEAREGRLDTSKDKPEDEA